METEQSLSDDDAYNGSQPLNAEKTVPDRVECSSEILSQLIEKAPRKVNYSINASQYQIHYPI